MLTNIGNIGDAPRVAQPEPRRATIPESSVKPRRDADVVELRAEIPTSGVYAKDAPGQWQGGGGELPVDLKALLAFGSGSGADGEASREVAGLIAEVLDRLATNREMDVARLRAAVEEWRAEEAKGEAGPLELVRLLQNALGAPVVIPPDA